MLTTPGRRKMDDKENIGFMVKTTGKSVNSGVTPARKPLTWINQDTTSQRLKPTGKVLQKIWSTAEDSTTSRMTASKTSKKIKKTERKSRGPLLESTFACTKKTAMSITEAAETILNEVLLEEISDIQKDSVATLTESNKHQKSHTALEKAVSLLVGDVLKAAFQELRDEQAQETTSLAQVIRTESLAVVADTPASEHLWHIALGIDDETCDTSGCVFQKNVCNTQFDHSPEKSRATRGVYEADKMLDVTPDKKRKSARKPSKYDASSVADVSTSIVTNKSVYNDAQNKLLGSAKASCDWGNETETRYKFISTSPIEVTDAASGTSPIKYTDANCETTPIKQVDMATVTTPITSVNTNIGTTPIKPVEMLNKSSMNTPVKMTDSALGTSPIKSADAKLGTTPVKLADVGLCTDQVSTTDRSTVTVPVSVAEVAMGTTPLKTADAMCGTIPVMLVDSTCGTTPSSLTEVGTAVTPLAVNVAETLTSPLVVPAFRLEAESPSQLDPTSLMRHMETASISNELLRREIKALQNQLDEVRSLQEERETAESMTHIKGAEVRQTIEASVDDLLQQVGEQMNQIAVLQEALDQKSAKLVASEQNKISLRDGYQKELHNLQEDLRRSYKQHQQEVSALREFYEQNNYEPHYKRAMATITELKMEIKVYTDLKDMLDKAEEVQGQFECVEEACSLVNALFKKTMDRRDELDKQHKEMLAEMARVNAQSELLQQQLVEADKQQCHLQMELDDVISAKNSALNSRGQLTQDLGEAIQVMDELKAEMHSTKLELFGYRNDYETVKSQNQDLEKQRVEDFLNVSSLEASLAIQGQQCQDVTVEKERLKSEMDRVQQENKRFIDEQNHLQSQLSSREDFISKMESELEQSKMMIRQQGAEMESMKTELKTTRQARADVQRLAGQVQTLRQHFKENIDFLEEERRALVESSREAEEQVKITTLEMSRLKGALTRAEKISSQWKTAADNLSEELQVSQSELDHTKANAHWMLLNQADELRDVATSLISFRQKIQNIYSSFRTRYQEVKTTKNSDQETDESSTSTLNSKSNPHPQVPPSTSLVASVLSAINATDDDHSHNDHPSPPQAATTSDDQHSDKPSPSETKLAIGASGSSAFTTVQPCTNPSSPLSEEGSSRIGDDAPLVSQVEEARKWFQKLLQLLLAQNESLESTVLGLKQESAQLNSQLLRQQEDCNYELSALQEKLKNSELKERELGQEAAKSNLAVAELQQELQYTLHQMQAMADKLARSSDHKMMTEKLQTEMAKLSSNLRLVQRERSLIQEQLDVVLSSCSRSTGAEDAGAMLNKTAVNSKLIKENLRLKKELEKLTFRQAEQQDHYETLNVRATRHMQVMRDNWHKADVEISRLDELFDHCKQLMEKVPATSEEHSCLTTLRELLS